MKGFWRMTAHVSPSKSVRTKQPDDSPPYPKDKNAGCETKTDEWGEVSLGNGSVDEGKIALHIRKDVENGIISEEMSQGSESNLKERGERMGSSDSVAVTTSTASNSENDCQSPPPKRLPLHEQDLEILSLKDNLDHASNTARRMDSSLSKESSPSNASSTNLVCCGENGSLANRSQSPDLSPDKRKEGSMSPIHQDIKSPDLMLTERLNVPVETREMEIVITKKKNDLAPEASMSDDGALPVPQTRIATSLLFSPTPSSSNTPDLTSLIATHEIGDHKGGEPMSRAGIASNHSSVQGNFPANAQSTQSDEINESFPEDNKMYEKEKNDMEEASVDAANIQTSIESCSDYPGNASDSSGGLLNVSTALDHVLSEMRCDSKNDHEKNSTRKRPCVLQQCLVADAGSGTSTPSEESNASSLKVESSMLLSEESLNQIAQMTLNVGSKTNRKSVVTFQMDSNSNLGEEILTNGDKVNNNSSHGKEKIARQSSMPTESELKSGAPIISGTAAATEYQTRARNSTGNLGRIGTIPIGPQSQSPERSKPLPPPPQLISCAITDASESPENGRLKKSECESASESKSTNKKASLSQPVCIVQQGMDMLADIISHAVPVTVGTQHSDDGQTSKLIEISHENKNNPDQCSQGQYQSTEMVPVGQSLSVYSAIAAQAGIPAHAAVEKSDLSTEKSHVETISTTTQSNIQEFNQTVQSQTETPPEPIYYRREIGKIRRYSSERGDFGDWEDLPFQISGGTLPRRWCDLNIDESIEIPLRRGGRLRVFPNFLADGRRSKVFDSAEKCPYYRQYTAQTEVPYVEPRVHVLLSSQAKKTEMDNEVGVGHVYRGVTVKAKPLSLVPEVESLSQDLADLYRIGQWDIGVDLVSYRNGKEHIPWHSNNTQGEVLILCIVLKSHKSLEHIRPILVKPKSNLKPLEDGDEEIIIFVGEGDAYEMDGKLSQLSNLFVFSKCLHFLIIPLYPFSYKVQCNYLTNIACRRRIKEKMRKEVLLYLGMAHQSLCLVTQEYLLVYVQTLTNRYLLLATQKLLFFLQEYILDILEIIQF